MVSKGRERDRRERVRGSGKEGGTKGEKAVIGSL
jgi:hypothetical protein